MQQRAEPRRRITPRRRDDAPARLTAPENKGERRAPSRSRRASEGRHHGVTDADVRLGGLDDWQRVELQVSLAEEAEACLRG